MMTMLSDDILAMLKQRPMTYRELAKALCRKDSDILLVLHGPELKGLVEMEPAGKWKRIPSVS